jgi:triacylglycerol lipase
LKATEQFWPELPQHILESRDNSQSIWFTGHSLGGALAVLASAKFLVEQNVEVAGLYTFGQPSVGSESCCSGFEKRCRGRLYRFINHTDAVSDSPLLFYEHVGQVRYFDTSGTLWEGEPPWRVSMLDHMRAPRMHGGNSQFVAHSMRNYVDLLEAECRRAAGASGGPQQGK